MREEVEIVLHYFFGTFFQSEYLHLRNKTDIIAISELNGEAGQINFGTSVSIIVDTYNFSAPVFRGNSEKVLLRNAR